NDPSRLIVMGNLRRCRWTREVRQFRKGSKSLCRTASRFPHPDPPTGRGNSRRQVRLFGKFVGQTPRWVVQASGGFSLPMNLPPLPPSGHPLPLGGGEGRGEGAVGRFKGARRAQSSGRSLLGERAGPSPAVAILLRMTGLASAREGGVRASVSSNPIFGVGGSNFIPHSLFRTPRFE